MGCNDWSGSLPVFSERWQSRGGLERGGKTIAVGAEEVLHLVRLENLLVASPLVTAWSSPTAGGVAAGCPACRRWFELNQAEVGTEVCCPYCRCRIRLNNFVVNAEWRPVAEAWHEVSVPTPGKKLA